MGTYTDGAPPTGSDSYAVSAVNSAGQSAKSAAASVTVGGGGGAKKVVWIPFENHNRAAVVASGPHFVSLAHAGAEATNFTSKLHPSLPNYMDFSGGTPNGITTDCDACMVPAKSLWDLVEAAGQTIECYAEGLALTTPPYNYNVVFPSSAAKEYDNHHVWPVHYSLIMNSAARKAKIKDLTALNLGALPDFTIIVPNVFHDGHTCPSSGCNLVALADAWAAVNIPPLISVADLVIIWWDEGSGPLFLAFCGPGAKPGAVSAVAYGNHDLLRTIEAYMGLGSLGSGDATAKVMSDLVL